MKEVQELHQKAMIFAESAQMKNSKAMFKNH